MDKYKKFGKNILLLLSGNFVSKILSFLMVPFYTSILSTSDYGTADIISTTVLLVLPFFSVLMDEAIIRFVLDTNRDKKQVFSIALMISTAGFLLAMCISPIILLFPALKSYYWFVILYYISIWLYTTFSNYVKGLDKFAIDTIAGIIHTFLYLCLNIIFLAVLKWGVYGYLLAIDLSNLIAAVFLFLFCKLYNNFIFIKKLDWLLAKEMMKYSVPLIPNYISWWINNASDRYILAMFCDTGIIGIYSVAYKIPTILNSLTSICSNAWKISAVDKFGSKESIIFYNRIYKLYSGILLMTASVLILFTKVLAKILFAKDFFDAWRITPILLLGYVFSAQAIFLGSIFSASKKTKLAFWPSMAGAVVNVSLNFILIPLMEGYGAAIATSVGYLVILGIDIILTSNILPMDFVIKKNSIGYVLITIEIIAMISGVLQGYIIAVLSTGTVILLYTKEFAYFMRILLIQKKNKKGRREE